MAETIVFKASKSRDPGVAIPAHHAADKPMPLIHSQPTQTSTASRMTPNQRTALMAAMVLLAATAIYRQEHELKRLRVAVAEMANDRNSHVEPLDYVHRRYRTGRSLRRCEWRCPGFINSKPH